MERYRGSQRAACSASRFANEVGTEFGVQSTAIDRLWLVDRMAEAPTISELRTMSDVVKDANLAVEQRGTRACAVGRQGDGREQAGETGFARPCQFPNRKLLCEAWPQGEC